MIALRIDIFISQFLACTYDFFESGFGDMIDRELESIVDQRLNPRLGQKKLWLASAASGVFGVLLGVTISVAYFSATHHGMSEDELGKLSALAACSTGQTPAIEWELARRKVQWPLDPIDASQDKIAQELLSVIHPERCFARVAENGEGDEGVKY